MLPSAHVDFRRQKAREVETDLPQLESFPLPVNLSAHIKWKAAVFPFHLSRGGRNLRNNRDLAVHPRSVFAGDWCSELQHGCVDSSHTSLIAKGIWPRFLICSSRQAAALGSSGSWRKTARHPQQGTVRGHTGAARFRAAALVHTTFHCAAVVRGCTRQRLHGGDAVGAGQG